MDKRFSVNGIHCRVNERGRVKVMPGRYHLKAYPHDKTGDLMVNIDNIPHKVSELVLTHHDRPPVKGEKVRYKDGNKRNVRLSNLEWASPTMSGAEKSGALPMEARKAIYEMKQSKIANAEIVKHVWDTYGVDVKPNNLAQIARTYEGSLMAKAKRGDDVSHLTGENPPEENTG